MKKEGAKLLLIDTCAEGAGMALSLGEQVLAIESLAPRAASAEIVSALRRLLQSTEWTLRDLNAVGVVGGPGSFTGVRAGLAAAKGFCEAASLRMAAVSRLEVLAEAAVASDDIVAVLDAGRDQLYAREKRAGSPAREWLCGSEELREIATGRSVVVAEERLAEQLGGCRVVLRPLTVADALLPVLRCLGEGGSDMATVDANYVRGEGDIYRRQPQTATIRQGNA